MAEARGRRIAWFLHHAALRRRPGRGRHGLLVREARAAGAFARPHRGVIASPSSRPATFTDRTTARSGRRRFVWGASSGFVVGPAMQPAMAGESRLGAVVYRLRGSEVEVEIRRRRRLDRRYRIDDVIHEVYPPRRRRPEIAAAGANRGGRRASVYRKVVRRDAGARRHRPRRRGRRVPDPGRPVRLRQVDPDPHHRRPREPQDRRLGPDRRRADRPSAAARAARRDGVPELRALPAHDGAGEHRACRSTMSRLSPVGAPAPREAPVGAAPARSCARSSARCEAVARSSSSSALLDRRPAQLSGGQRQRVALGRAMVRHPDVFLMDEPLSNLDAKLRVHMRTELAELHERLGATFIYVTHDQVEAMTMSDRVAMMDAGRHPPARHAGRALRSARPNVKVAQFIGSPAINLLPGTGRRGRRGRAARPPAAARGRACRRASPVTHRHPARGDRARDPRRGGLRPRCLAARRACAAARTSAPSTSSTSTSPGARRLAPIVGRVAGSSCALPADGQVDARLRRRRLPPLRRRRASASQHGARTQAKPQAREPARRASSGTDALMDVGAPLAPAASAARAQHLDRDADRHRLRAAGLRPAPPHQSAAAVAVLFYLSFTDYELGALDAALRRARQLRQGDADPVFRRSLSNTLLYVAIVLPGAVVLGAPDRVLVHGRKRTRSLLRGRLLPAGHLDADRHGDRVAVPAPSAARPGQRASCAGSASARSPSSASRRLVSADARRDRHLAARSASTWCCSSPACRPSRATSTRRRRSTAAPSGIDRFLTITWPLLGPTTMFVIVTTSITAFKVFDTVAVMTRGGPMGSSEVLLYDDLPRRLSVLPHRLRRGADRDLPRLHPRLLGRPDLRPRPAGALLMGAAASSPAVRRGDRGSGPAPRRVACSSSTRSCSPARSSCCCRSSGCWSPRSSRRPRSSAPTSRLWPKQFYGVENYDLRARPARRCCASR